MLRHLKLTDYIPLSLAIIVGAFLVAPNSSADPAILNGANGADCQLPIDSYNAKNQLDYQPSDENGVNILVINKKAFAVCDSVDLKVRPAALAKLNITTLPFVVKITSKDLPRVWCRIEDSDDTLYYSRNWAALFRVDLTGATYKVTKKLLCRDGITAGKK